MRYIHYGHQKKISLIGYVGLRKFSAKVEFELEFKKLVTLLLRRGEVNSTTLTKYNELNGLGLVVCNKYHRR